MNSSTPQKAELTKAQLDHIANEYGGDLHAFLLDRLPKPTLWQRLKGENNFLYIALGIIVAGFCVMHFLQQEAIERMSAQHLAEVHGLEEKVEIFERIRMTNQLSDKDKRAGILKIIEQNPASINSQDRYGRTALYNLAHWGDDDEKTFHAMARMIEAGADLNIARYQWGGGHKVKKGFLSDNGSSIIQNLIRNQKHTVAVQLAIVYADKIDWGYKNYNGHSNMSYLVDLVHNNPMHLDLKRLKRIVSAYHSESRE